MVLAQVERRTIEIVDNVVSEGLSDADFRQLFSARSVPVLKFPHTSIPFLRRRD